jgi:hypothetical protein
LHEPVDAGLPVAAETVLTFLSSVGRPSEANLYLKLFRETPRQRFALVVVEPSLVREAAGLLVEHVRFLSQLGLVAPIVIGVFESRGARRAAEQLASKLSLAGLGPAVVEGPHADLCSRVEGALALDRIPLVALGASHGVESRVEALKSLAIGLQSSRAVVLRRQGALGPPGNRELDCGDGHLVQCHSWGIAFVNTRSDIEPLRRSGAVDAEDLRTVDVAAYLLADTGLTHVSVTHPLNLLRELFTVKGAGTLVRRGTSLLRIEGGAELDAVRLRGLLESSFRRSLRPEFFDRKPLVTYLEENYHAAAIIEPSPVAPLLGKFAVDPVAQGEGMGRDLWHAVVREHPNLMWRARADNPIARWYAEHCDGMLRTERWLVFWRGLAPNLAEDVVREVVGRPEDFTGPRLGEE